VTRLPLAGLLAVGLFAVTAKPVAAHAPEEVQALLESAVDPIHVHGRTQAFADFSRNARNRALLVAIIRKIERRQLRGR
jgi:hypothetical protein